MTKKKRFGILDQYRKIYTQWDNALLLCVRIYCFHLFYWELCKRLYMGWCMCCEPCNIFEHLKRCKKLQFHPLKAGKHADTDMLWFGKFTHPSLSWRSVTLTWM